MSRTLAARVARLEPRPVRQSAPHVLSIGPGETVEAALAQFRIRHAGEIERRHGLIVLPARIETPEDEAVFAVRFHAQQMQLVATAKAKARPKDEFNG